MGIDIEPRHLKIVNNILKENIGDLNAQVFAFGSRTNSKARQYSDLDLTIDCKGQKLPFEILAKLSYSFENSLLPYKVDIVDLNNISKEFKKIIKNDLVQLKYN
ncbi:MAG: nucleotidyltransferase domain-containing protein [Elusimicrobiota bacterium]|jgi:type I restriction enzyme S subunit|nr:nucleotidyltransferase domain-containing protein [Elusimicrobiota bacterium]